MIVRAVLLASIRFYRRAISPWLPAVCRFEPSCSQYAIEAIELHGALRGSRLTIWRLLRCQPLCRGGFDPVPPNFGNTDAISGTEDPRGLI